MISSVAEFVKNFDEVDDVQKLQANQATRLYVIQRMPDSRKRIAVLGSADSWYTHDLRRAAEARGHELIALPFTELQADISSDGESIGSGGQRLDDVDAVIVRSMPGGSLEQVVFRMNALARLEANGVRVLNPPRALEIAIDKYLALAKLRDAGLLTPDTECCQTWEQAMDAFERLGDDVVIKPVFGGEGRGITRVSDPALMLRAAKSLAQLGSVIYLQRFLPHGGFDQRLLVLGDEVFGMIRRNTHDWRTNVSLGATTEPLTLTPELAEQARAASAVVGAPFCAVDLLPANDGQTYALEVNAVPGWRALGRTLGVDVADKVVEFAMRHRTS